MPLASMTGFARSDATHGVVRLHWELRSVNGRGLDIRLRLPPGHEALEAVCREAIGRRFTRGSITANLAIDQTAASGELRVNEAALASVMAAVRRLAAMPGFDRPRPESILALRGVLESSESQGSAADADLLAVAMKALETALDGLADGRRREGERLGIVLGAAVDRITALVGAITALPSRTPDAVRARLAEQVQRLMETGATFDAARLHQEAVLIATRADVEEEVKRLGSHISAARGLLGEAGPVGRKLDFLTQEFNREVNTICSKANDIEMTRLGLELKAVIDQVREQVQNIE
jgi:uncharacterized protein (TIGR00255 family)